MTLSSATNRKRAFLQSLVHYIAGFVVLMKCLSKLDHAHEYLGYILFLVLSGALVILGAIFHHRLEKRFVYFTSLIHFLESLVLMVIAYLYIQEGKAALQYAFLLAGLLSAVAGIITGLKQRFKPEPLE